MKRIIKWFQQEISKLNNKEKIIGIIGAVMGILIGVGLFVTTDIVPATAKDYEPMEKQAMAIQENPKLIYETDCTVMNKSGITIVTFMNEECKLIAKYNQNFELISTQREENDDYIVWWLAILISILVAIIAFGGYVIILSSVVDAFVGLRKMYCKKH